MVDVLVIGGGNAALCAALMAREAGASVLLLEAAPRAWRGGNSQHTRNLRCMHEAPQDVLIEAYPEEEYWQDLRKVTAGRTDERLARLAIRASSSCRDWMRRHDEGRVTPRLVIGLAIMSAGLPLGILDDAVPQGPSVEFARFVGIRLRVHCVLR